jgi:hypothetical protein
MPRAPYVDERKVEYYTSHELDNFLKNQGFDILPLPLTPVTEKGAPTDFAFWAKNTKKLFGFQYKALYHNGQDAWTLDEDQHAQLRRFVWIYYGLSDLTSLAQHRDALDHLRVLPPGFRYSNRLTSTDLQQLGGRDLRWEEFFEGLQTCKYGRKVRNRKDFLRALWPHTADVPPEITRIVNDIVVVDFVNRRARKFTL